MVLFHPASLVVLLGVQVCSTTHTEGAASDTMAPPEVAEFNRTIYAACQMRPSSKLAVGLPKVYGHVMFKQEYPGGTLKALLHLRGFPDQSSQTRAVHIHQYGDISEGCDSTGGHYNPYRVPHPSHPGDFGNFVAHQGRVHRELESEATLSGGLSVLGRAVVVHEGVDDLGQGGNAGSLLHGNAGRRLACCAIGMSTPKLWNKHYQRHERRRGRGSQTA